MCRSNAFAQSGANLVEEGDPNSCDYWRYCAIDGFLCGGYDTRDAYGTRMRAVAASLDNAAQQSLAGHYARQQLELPKASMVEPSTHGEKLYQGTCAACHGPHGEGYALLKTPNLRILDAAYLERQLTHYAEGLRGSEAHADQHGSWMRGVALQIGGAAERKALIDYIGTLSAASQVSHH